MITTLLMRRLKSYGADTEGIAERFMGDSEFYESCLKKFIADKNFAMLGQAIANNEYHAAFVSAHALKGLSANMGLTPLFDAIYIIVEALRTENTDELESQYADIMTQYDIVKGML